MEGSYVYGKERAFFSRDGVAALVRALAGFGTELRVELEEEALLVAFRAAFHPFPLRHERNGAFSGNVDRFGRLVHLDDFLTSVFGEKDTYGTAISKMSCVRGQNIPAYGSLSAAFSPVFASYACSSSDS